MHICRARRARTLKCLLYQIVLIPHINCRRWRRRRWLRCRISATAPEQTALWDYYVKHAVLIFLSVLLCLVRVYCVYCAGDIVSIAVINTRRTAC